jgi:hypothetical protein
MCPGACSAMCPGAYTAMYPGAYTGICPGRILQWVEEGGGGHDSQGISKFNSV